MGSGMGTACHVLLDTSARPSGRMVRMVVAQGYEVIVDGVVPVQAHRTTNRPAHPTMHGAFSDLRVHILPIGDGMRSGRSSHAASRPFASLPLPLHLLAGDADATRDPGMPFEVAEMQSILMQAVAEVQFGSVSCRSNGAPTPTAASMDGSRAAGSCSSSAEKGGDGGGGGGAADAVLQGPCNPAGPAWTSQRQRK